MQNRIPVAAGLIAIAALMIVVVVLRDDPTGGLLYLAAFLVGAGIGYLTKRLPGAIVGGIVAVVVFHFGIAAFIVFRLANPQ